MDISTWAAFQTAITEADNLLSIHGAVRTGRGRRFKEPSLNRAAVVFAVGAWQTFVEGSVRYFLESMEPDPSHHEDGSRNPDYLAALSAWRVVNAAATNALGRFNTPRADEVRSLYRFVGHDPFSSWAWSTGSHTTTSRATALKLDAWLLVRNAIAHGSGTLPDVDVLNKKPDGTRTLHKKNASSCIQFVRQLVNQTDRGLPVR